MDLAMTLGIMLSLTVIAVIVYGVSYGIKADKKKQEEAKRKEEERRRTPPSNGAVQNAAPPLRRTDKNGRRISAGVELNDPLDGVFELGAAPAPVNAPLDGIFELGAPGTGKIPANKTKAAAGQKKQPSGQKLQSAGHHAEHCAVPHSGREAYAVERVPTGGSIRGARPEGCADHYGVRFVKKNDTKAPADEEKIYVSAEDARRAIVLGQVLNDPAFKRRYRR